MIAMTLSLLRPRLRSFALSLRVAAGLGLALALAACGSAPVPTFDLTAPGGFTAGGRGAGQMVVVTPTALSVLDTEKIVVEPAPGQITYLSDAQWADRLPALLQARMIQAFENGSKLARVARPSDGVSADYQLVSDIRAFGVRGTGGTLEAVVELSAKLINNRSGRIVDARLFSARAPIAAVNGAAVTSALDVASGKVLVELVRWASARF